MNCDPGVAVQKWETRKTTTTKKKTNKDTGTKTDKEMKTNLPTTICLIGFFFGVSVRFYLIKYGIVYISFEGRAE